MKKWKLSLGIVFIASLAQAHEFWLQPKKYRYAVGDEIRIDFMVGEHFTGEYWDLTRHKVEKMELHRKSVVTPLAGAVKSTKGNNLILRANQEGTYLFTLQSNAAYIELDGDEFNTYLKEDGLEEILAERKKLNLSERRSRENYTRFAKLLVQVGNATDDTYKKRTGLRYEIVPDENPYSLKTGDYLQCKVYFEGKPAPHALVKVWSVVNETTFLQNIYTENDGSIRFPISTKGPWMVSSVKMIYADGKAADYHSLWASLVFGIL
jgi:uncharacterized GH25 family protein